MKPTGKISNLLYFKAFKILPKFSVREEKAPEGSLTAPMPGKVVEIKIKKGSKIKKGDTLLILEAMKMEHVIKASGSGIVSAVSFAEGEIVDDGAVLVELEVGADDIAA